MANNVTKPLDYSQFIDSLKSDNLIPVYIFCGDEEYFISQAISELRSTLEKKFGELEYTSVDHDAVSVNELLSGAKSVSLFGTRKLFILKGCDKFTKGENNLLDRYLENPVTSSYLVMLYTDSKKMKLDSSNLSVVNIPRDDRNVLYHLKKIIESRNYKINNDALNMLIDLVGNNLGELSNEVDKILVFKKDQSEISKSDIENYVKRTNYGDIFQLINAICNRDRNLALRKLSELEQLKEEPIAIINRISWRLRQIWQVKELVDEGRSRNEITSELNISSGNLYYVQKQAQNFSYTDIKKFMNNIYSTDLKLKTTQIPPYYILTNSVLEMCS